MYQPLINNDRNTRQNVISSIAEHDDTPTETKVVKTDYGDLNVTIAGTIEPSGRPPIVTYHDIGMSHVACFQNFFNVIKRSGHVMADFPIVHIDAPGHSSGAEDLPDSIDAFDLEELSKGVEEVVKMLKVRRAFCFGLGAGATVMTLFAGRRPDLCHGLILVNPTASPPSWFSTGQRWLERAFGSVGHKAELASARSTLLKRWFPSGIGPPNVLQYFTSETHALNEKNFLKYYRGFRARKDVSEKVKAIKNKSIVFIGRSADYKEGLYVQSLLPPDRTDYIMERYHAVLMTETAVPKMLSPLKLWFEALGFFPPRPKLTAAKADSKSSTPAC